MTESMQHKGNNPVRSLDAALEAFNGDHGENLDLFVYGTLMSDEHVKLLINRVVDSEPATLLNYMKIVPPGAFYFIVKQHASSVPGRVLKGLTPDEIARIDSFEDEGKLYFRRPVVIRTSQGFRRRCMTYVGNVPALQKAFGHDILFEDRYSDYLERKIDQTLEDSYGGFEGGGVAPQNRQLMREALRELMGSEINTIIESRFDGDYVCNYIMSQTFSDAQPPFLPKVFANPQIRPYADNYIKFACKHIILNQLAERIRHEFHNAVRVSRQYFRHGTATLLAFIYFNRNKAMINELMSEFYLDRADDLRLYRDYAAAAIRLVEEIYEHDQMKEIIDHVAANWSSTPTPLGAELEFSSLGAGAVYAEAGEDPVYDSFYWFNDFDLQRRLWRLGGHVDAHKTITAGGRIRHRGFLEYALGRFNIAGDLSLPVFDCPWAMSKLINEAVKFAEIPPHSLHISLQLEKIGGRPVITDRAHEESDLACMLLLGGDLHPDTDGILREWRVCNNELDTNSRNSLNFCDRKHHYCRLNDEGSGNDVMEYKFLRLFPAEYDYTKVIFALKDYQIETRARPITIARPGQQELPEQLFMRQWCANPQALSMTEINDFLAKIERGMLKEYNVSTLNKQRKKVLENIYTSLIEKNEYVRSFQR